MHNLSDLSRAYWHSFIAHKTKSNLNIKGIHTTLHKFWFSCILIMQLLLLTKSVFRVFAQSCNNFKRKTIFLQYYLNLGNGTKCWFDRIFKFLCLNIFDLKCKFEAAWIQIIMHIGKMQIYSFLGNIGERYFHIDYIWIHKCTPISIILSLKIILSFQ